MAARYSVGLFIAVAVCACRLSARDLLDDRSMVASHEQWMAKYGRTYSDVSRKLAGCLAPGLKGQRGFIDSVNARKDKFSSRPTSSQILPTMNSEHSHGV